MPHDCNVGKCRSVWHAPWLHANGVEDPSHRTDRVPQTEKVRLAGNGKCTFEACGKLKPVDVTALEKAQRIGNETFVSHAQQSAHVQQSAQCAGGVGATTEAKNKNRISLLEFLHQERICVRNVVREAIAEGQAPRFGPRLTKAG